MMNTGLKSSGKGKLDSEEKKKVSVIYLCLWKELYCHQDGDGKATISYNIYKQIVVTSKLRTAGSNMKKKSLRVDLTILSLDRKQYHIPKKLAQIL